VAYEQVIYQRRDPEAVAVITLNRPEKLNAWNPTLQRELREAIGVANDDPAVGAIVLTGAGRAYCAGADIGNWQRNLEGGTGDAFRGGSGAAERGPRPEDENIVALIRRSKPVIAAVNGVAVGVGVTHILPADIRIASENARFGFIFVRMGVVPELASTYYLSQIVGLAAAQELCLTAKMIDAAEALRLGLVSKVVAPERLVDEAVAVGAEIAALPPLQVRLTKQLFTRNATDADTAAVMAREGEALATAYASPEFKEAVSAFMEKRQPVFQR
jgi:enoyl-CoA hydratase/carnithine racemase